MTPVALAGAVVMPAAPAAPAAPVVAVVNEAPPHLAGGPADPVAGPLGGPVAPLDQLRGIALLDRLGTMPRGDVRAYLDAHPDVVLQLLAAPPSAAEVAAWWQGTGDAGRATLSGAAPQLLGNLEGVPYAVRDTANRALLRATERELDARIAGGIGRAARGELTTRRHMLSAIEQALVDGGAQGRRLVSLDVTGEGRAVIAVGDLARADYVSYLVPGMFFGVDEQIEAWTATAQALVDDQESWLQKLRPGSAVTVAAVAWIGYATPGLMDVASMELAREGRDALAASLQGLRAARGDHQPYLAVLAHSYGSTTALLALQDEDVAVDALALVGSPGSPARSVSELHVADGNVWVGAAEWDPVPASGVFGSQPSSRAFGAHLFSVAAGRDSLTGAPLTGAVAHNDYFAPGGMSLRNLALIAIGEDAAVTRPDTAAGDFARAFTRIR